MGWIEMLAGEPEKAERALRAGYDSLDAMGDRSTNATVAHRLAAALCAQGRWAEADRFAALTEELATADDLDAQRGWRLIRARLLARRGDQENARRLALESSELCRQMGHTTYQADAMVVLGEVMELAGDHAEAAKAVREALALYEAKEDLVSAQEARRLLADTLKCG